MLSAFQILAKKVPSSLRVSDLRGIQNNPPRGGELPISYTLEEEDISQNDRNKCNEFRYTRKYSNRNELKIFGIRTEEICLDSRTIPREPFVFDDLYCFCNSKPAILLPFLSKYKN